MFGYLYERQGLGDTTHDGSELVNSKRFAFLLYIGLTIMLFAGLFGGWFVLRGNNDVWPPLGTPPMTFIKVLPSIVVLLANVIAMILARNAMRQGALERFRTMTTISAGISVLFVLAFGLEWWRLIGGGVHFSTVFGGLYFTITGIFLLHFLGGSYGLVSYVRKAKDLPFSTPQLVGFNNTLTFYYLMFAMWFIMGTLAYIN
ncbi:MAG: cytochrome c oxidase subunit 3 [Bacteroidetes bacterium]|nr:cytochrome c oxidase subunit 3 [Bacteroidota bacterium]